MSERKIRKPCCSDCPHYLLYLNSVPKKVKGAFLKPGYPYCTGGKSTRQFKNVDPKVDTPSWCPCRKFPAELRIYCYKNDDIRFIRRMFHSDGDSVYPDGRDYAMRFETRITMTASEFYSKSEDAPIEDILGFAVHREEIIEIDDNLNRYYFFLNEYLVPQSVYFNGETARKNKLEQEEDK